MTSRSPADLKSIHCRLQCVDRVVTSLTMTRAPLSLERIGRASDIPVSGDERDLASDEYIGRTVEAVGKRVPHTILASCRILLLVTEPLTLIAADRNWPVRANSYRRCTPVVWFLW
jgi:hypothetical protein